MNAVRAWKRPDPLGPTPLDAIGEAVAVPRANADRWVATGIEDRLRLRFEFKPGLARLSPVLRAALEG